MLEQSLESAEPRCPCGSPGNMWGVNKGLYTKHLEQCLASGRKCLPVLLLLSLLFFILRWSRNWAKDFCLMKFYSPGSTKYIWLGKITTPRELGFRLLTLVCSFIWNVVAVSLHFLAAFTSFPYQRDRSLLFREHIVFILGCFHNISGIVSSCASRWATQGSPCPG